MRERENDASLVPSASRSHLDEKPRPTEAEVAELRAGLRAELTPPPPPSTFPSAAAGTLCLFFFQTLGEANTRSLSKSRRKKEALVLLSLSLFISLRLSLFISIRLSS